MSLINDTDFEETESVDTQEDLLHIHMLITMYLYLL